MATSGSAARGNLGPDSEVDVLVDLEPKAQLGWNFFGIAEELEAVLGRHVDLGTTDSLKPFAPRRPARSNQSFMRRDDVCLREMLAAIDQLLGLRDQPECERRFHNDRSCRHSVFFEFVVIGEQVGALSAEIQARDPEIPWRTIPHSGIASRTVTSS